MNYLLSAYSVNPYKGSEDYIGWNWILQLSKKVSANDTVYVITKKINENDTMQGLKENNIKNVKLIVVDVPRYLNWFREKYSIFHHMYYILWQNEAYKWVKKSKIKFDVIHHITMNDYRIVGKMYKFKDSYTILGPIGGAQITPKALECYETSKFQFKFRKMINFGCTYNPFYRNAINSFKEIYAINLETKKQIEKITNKECKILPELAISDKFKNIRIVEKNNKIINILFVGRIIGKKGVLLLVDIFKNIDKNINYILKIYGDGKEIAKVKKLLHKYKLESKVFLMGNKEFEEINKAYENADIYIMPSLRETSGNVLVEAMANALPIVGIDMSFEHQLNKIKCGIFIEPNQSRKNIIKDFNTAIKILAENKEKRLEYGMNGYKFVNNELTWEKKYHEIYVKNFRKE